MKRSLENDPRLKQEFTFSDTKNKYKRQILQADLKTEKNHSEKQNPHTIHILQQSHQPTSLNLPKFNLNDDKQILDFLTKHLYSYKVVELYAESLCEYYSRSVSHLSHSVSSNILRKLLLGPSKIGRKWAQTLMSSETFFKNMKQIPSEQMADIIRLGGEEVYAANEGKKNRHLLETWLQADQSSIRIAAINHSPTISLSLIKSLKDPSALVRRACLNRISILSSSEENFQPSNLVHKVYSSICSALDTDDMAVVRKAAMNCLKNVALAFPTRIASIKILQVKEGSLSTDKMMDPSIPKVNTGYIRNRNKLPLPQTTQQTKFIDDAFSRISNSIADCDFTNQIAAAKHLGEFAKAGENINVTDPDYKYKKQQAMVDIEYLMQTLQKQIMSNLVKKKSFNEKERTGTLGSVEPAYSSGKNWDDDAPKKNLGLKTHFNSIDVSSCGAFTHGLESENSKVRLESIESLTILVISKKSTHFAKKALDALIDMLNDEIEGVRLSAVNGVTKILNFSEGAGNVTDFMNMKTLYTDQLTNVIAALDDTVTEIRTAVRGVLGSCTVPEVDSLFQIVRMLEKNLIKYPGDTESIYETFSNLGKNHASLTQVLTSSLLGIDPNLDSREPNLNDPIYLGKLVMILKAAKILPVITTMVPSYVKSHYQFLKHAMRERIDLIPGLESGFVGVHSLSDDKNQDLTDEIESIEIEGASCTSDDHDSAINVDMSEYLSTTIEENFTNLSDISEVKETILEYIKVTDKKTIQHSRAKAIFYFVKCVEKLMAKNNDQEVVISEDDNQNDKESNENHKDELKLLTNTFYNSRDLDDFVKELKIREILASTSLSKLVKFFKIYTKFTPKTDLSIILANYIRKRLNTTAALVDNKKFKKFAKDVSNHDNLYTLTKLKEILKILTTSKCKHVFAEIVAPKFRSDFELDIVVNLSVKVPIVAKIYNFSDHLSKNFYVRVRYLDNVLMHGTGSGNSDEDNIYTQKIKENNNHHPERTFYLKTNPSDFFPDENATRLDTFVDISPIGDWPKAVMESSQSLSKFSVEITVGIVKCDALESGKMVNISEESFVEVCESVRFPFYTKSFV